MSELGLWSGRGARPKGECLLAGCVEAAGKTLIEVVTPVGRGAVVPSGSGDDLVSVRGYVCNHHARLVADGTVRGVSLAVEPLLASPAKPEAV